METQCTPFWGYRKWQRVVVEDKCMNGVAKCTDFNPGTPSARFPELAFSFAQMRSTVDRSQLLRGRRAQLLDDGRTAAFDVVQSAGVPDLIRMEALFVQRRRLRGVVALLACISVSLSIFNIGRLAFAVNLTIWIVSQVASIIISQIYKVKAKETGLTNVLFKSRSSFTSPYLPRMLCELLIWGLQTPPVVSFGHVFFDLLNYTILLRLYAVVLFAGYLAPTSSPFTRAFSALSKLPMGTSFAVRRAVAHYPLCLLVCGVMCLWVSLGCVYARAEGIALNAALGLVFQWLTFISMNDAPPVSLPGRVVALMAWTCRLVLLSYLLLLLHWALQHVEEHSNDYIVHRCHELQRGVRWKSAHSIQVAWRFHRARHAVKRGVFVWMKMYFLSWKLIYVLAARRRYCEQLRATQLHLNRCDSVPSDGRHFNPQTSCRHCMCNNAIHLKQSGNSNHTASVCYSSETLAPGAAVGDVEPFLQLSPLFPQTRQTLDKGLPRHNSQASSYDTLRSRRLCQLEEKCKSLTTFLDTLIAAKGALPGDPPHADMLPVPHV